MLETRRLALLVGVAKHGSIAAAAAAAGCTPSSASEQLTKLERELGIVLLERGARSVRLTAAGSELVEHGRRILAQINSAERAVEEVAGLSAGRLRIAGYHTGASRFLIPSINAFLRRHPRVRITFDEMEPENALPAVRDGDIDLALIHRYMGLQVPDASGLEVVELQKDPLILAVPDRLATHDSPTSMQAFSDAPWISLRPNEGFQAITELAAARAGFTPTIVARADNYGLILDLVAAGLGVALIPGQAMQPRMGVQTYTVEDPAGLAREESIVMRRADRSRGTLEMRDLVIRHVRTLPKRR